MTGRGLCTIGAAALERDDDDDDVNHPTRHDDSICVDIPTAANTQGERSGWERGGGSSRSSIKRVFPHVDLTAFAFDAMEFEDIPSDTLLSEGACILYGIGGVGGGEASSGGT